MPSMIQCIEPCNLAMDAICSIERWKRVPGGKGLSSGKVLISLEVSLNDLVKFRNIKKLEQAQKRQKECELDECLAQSSYIAEVSSPRRSSSYQETAIKFRTDSRQNECV